MIQILIILWFTFGVIGVILFAISMIMDYHKTNIAFNTSAYIIVSIIILVTGIFGFAFSIIGTISVIVDQTESSI